MDESTGDGDMPAAEAPTREDFNRGPASAIAEQLGMSKRSATGRSARFSYFEDEKRFLVVAGRSEVPDVDLGLVYGLSWAGQKQLVLALPAGCTTATAQRVPWLSEDRRPQLYQHSIDGRVRPVAPRAREDTLAAVRMQSLRDLGIGLLPPGDDVPNTSLAAVSQLVALARSERLDSAHRPGVHSWHCQGLRVLSAQANRAQVTVRAGVHHTATGWRPLAITLPTESLLTDEQVEELRGEVLKAVDQRLNGPTGSLHRPDEHWLQAVIRSRPHLGGLRGSAHREVAVWRPRDGAPWTRGFIDLVGTGEDGSIRVVETKLAANEDTRFVVQALDYFVWATAHREQLATALDLPSDARLDMRLLVGSGPDGGLALSRYSRSVAEALARDVPWSFASVTDWFESEPRAQVEPAQTVPAGWSNAGRATGNDYVDAARAAAEKWKVTSPTIAPDARRPGHYRATPGSAVYGFCLPREHAGLNLLPEVRDLVRAHFREHSISWHASVDGGPTTHLLSSQVQCVNALGQMIRDPARIEAAFGDRLEIGSIDRIDEGYMTFEWVPGKDYLGESKKGSLRRGAGNTSMDAAFRFTTRTGTSALALVEWKFTESYTRTRRANAASDETRRGRYEQLVNDPSGPINPNVLPFEDLLDEPFYQLVRQQLLAGAIEADPTEPVAEVHIVHVVPRANRAYEASLVRDSHRAQGDDVSDVWAKLNKRRERYHRLDSAVFLDPAITSPEYVARYAIPKSTAVMTESVDDAGN